MTGDNPLALATWDELMDEMCSRVEAIVVVAMKSDKTRNDGWWPEYHQKGGPFAAIGMCRYAERIWLDRITAGEADNGGDE